MEDFLVVRDFGKTRPPTKEKILRDGIMMYCEARYVIVLDEHGEVVERINRSITYTGNFLVVLAPIIHEGKKIELSVVLEIGLSRSVPYQQFEKNFADGKFAVKGRRPVAKLTDEKIIELLLTFSQIIQDVVDEETSHRKRLIWKKYGKDKKEMPIGIFVTVPFEASPLVYICLEKDFIERANGHLQLFVNMTREKLRKLKFAYYPKDEIKRFKVAQEIASILFDANYPSHFLEVIRRKLGKETGKIRSLFEQIIEEFEIKTKEKDDLDVLHENLEKVFGENKDILINSFPISVQTHPKRNNRRSTHAKDCLRIEIHPSKEAIEEKHKET